MKILFLHQGLISFVQRDLEILQSAHQVLNVRYRGIQDLPVLIRGMIWADLAFSWFGKLHAFFAVLLARRFGRRTVVVAGGDDVAWEPEINYGMFAYWWKKWCPRFVFHNTDLILSVSEFTRRETIENARADPARVKVIYHGFDTRRFRPLGSLRRRSAITVGGVDWERLERKGYERFVRSAAYLPEVPFILAGQWHDNAVDHLRRIAPDNVTLTGRLQEDRLLQELRGATVYVQPSIHEGFGCSLAEAMLCGCVPVVSRRAALPEVAGARAFYLDELTPRAVAAQIEEALTSGRGHRARQRIARKFPLQRRREAVLAAIDEVMHP